MRLNPLTSLMHLKKLAGILFFGAALVFVQSEYSPYPLTAKAGTEVSNWSLARNDGTPPACDLANKSKPSSCVYSPLWGAAGEKWKASGELPDFSYAGYHAGEAKIPALPA